MTLPVVNLKSALVNKAGFILQPWITFFQQFTQAPSRATAVDVSSGSYTAAEPGILFVTGATTITLTRGTTTVTTTDNFVPVAIKDTVTFTGGSPVATFFPSF